MNSNPLMKRIKLCKSIIESERKKNQNCPKGYVKATLVHNNGSDVFQYYLRENSSDPTGRYLKRSEADLARKLAQKEYCERVLKAAEKEKALIEEFLKRYDADLILKAYTEMKPGKRILVEPYVYPDDEYASKWQAKQFTCGSFGEGDPVYYTKRGDRVRSKSEQIIADRLFDAGIPYRYEFPFLYEGTKRIFTDFTVLNVKTRKEVRWEHFGKMDDPRYRKTFFWKQSLYAQYGLIPGEDIIFTFEDDENPLDSRYLDRLIKSFFL